MTLDKLILTSLLLASATAMAAGAPDEKAQLGQALFFDSNLSQPAGQACASCHDPGRAFSDPNRDEIVAKGVLPGRVGNRNVPAILYASYSPPFHHDDQDDTYVGGYFLDGRAASLEEQAKGPLLNPLEMANPDKRAVVDKVRSAAYAPLFKAVFGQDALNDSDKAYERIAEALAEYQRQPQFRPFSSKYDAWLAGRARLTAAEMRGLRLFEDKDKGNCAACHPSRPGPHGEPPLFTDFSYDNLGVPRNPELPFYRAGDKVNPEGELYVDRGLGGALKNRAEDGKFKVPTLRNIALTGPYMHNGYFKTLRGVLAFYNDRDTLPTCADSMTSAAQAQREKCWPAPEVITNVNHDELGKLGLTPREMDDIEAFLQSLSDGWRPPQTMAAK
jgi:cytochrome c peroxidase